MTDGTPTPSPTGELLMALDAFYARYRELLPSLNREQLRLLVRRLDRYAHEIEDDTTRAPEPHIPTPP